jgi:hypothetical protein
MLTVRSQDQNYRISNETLERLFGANWRTVNFGVLSRLIRKHHQAGKLIASGQWLRVASASEEAQHALRSAKTGEEILRSGLHYVASQLEAIMYELRALREALESESASSRELSRDPGEHGLKRSQRAG